MTNKVPPRQVGSDFTEADYLVAKIRGQLKTMYQDRGGIWDRSDTCKAYLQRDTHGRYPFQTRPHRLENFEEWQDRKGKGEDSK